MDLQTAPTSPEQRHELALQAAAELWSKATTDETSLRRIDLIRDKKKAVSGFFQFIKKLPGEVEARDVDAWRAELERRTLKPASVYAQISRLSSFSHAAGARCRRWPSYG